MSKRQFRLLENGLGNTRSHEDEMLEGEVPVGVFISDPEVYIFRHHLGRDMLRRS